MFLVYFATAYLLVTAVPVLVGLKFKVSRGVRTFTDGSKADDYDLPDWLKWWQNIEDGLTGDKRGRYWNTLEYAPPFVSLNFWINSPNFKMWWWSGIRNPLNYLKRFIIGIDIRKFTFHKLTGDNYVRDDLNSQGFQILYAMPVDGWFPRPMLYFVKDYGNGKGACIQLGWKIKLEHSISTYSSELDYWKGVTFEINFYKDLT